MGSSWPGRTSPCRAANRPYQAFSDTAHSNENRNEIAQSYYPGSTITQSHHTDRDQVEAVTTALTKASGQPSLVGVPGVDPLPGQLDRWLAARGAELVALRRHLHAHPELSGQEFESAALVAGQLSAAGLAPRLLPRGNGVICDILGDRDDPVVALRADLDALPLQDA